MTGKFLKIRKSKFGPRDEQISENFESQNLAFGPRARHLAPVTGKFLKIYYGKFGHRDWQIFENAKIKIWPP